MISNQTFKEGRDLTSVIPNAIQYDGSGDIHVIDDNTEVFVTFLHEGTPYEKFIGLFHI